MMINDIEKNELTEQEMNGVAGGFGSSNAYLYFKRTQEELQKQEAARQRIEAAKQKARQNEAARQEAIRQAEEANQPGIHIHGGGVSGGW